MKYAGSIALVFVSAAGLASGCNAILDNQEAVLDEGDASALTARDGSSFAIDVLIPGFDAGASDDAEALDSGTDAPQIEPDAGDDDSGTPECGPGKKLCYGACVATNDPVYGCAITSCTPCSVARASAICAGGKCAVGTCNAGYANCNQNPADGCETDLAKAAHCGTCNAACSGATPLCSATGGGFSCVNGCPGQAPTKCGSECINLTTSVNHCGQCNNACPAVANAQVSCVASNCRFACNPGFHACGAACASNTSPATCGSRCAPCPAPANGVATCVEGACGFTCNPGFHQCNGACVANTAVTSCGGSCTPCPARANATSSCSAGQCGFVCNTGFADCDNSAANGCEINLTNNTANCGACGTVCPGTACDAGVCEVPPPPPPDGGPSE